MGAHEVVQRRSAAVEGVAVDRLTVDARLGQQRGRRAVAAGVLPHGEAAPWQAVEPRAGAVAQHAAAVGAQAGDPQWLAAQQLPETGTFGDVAAPLLEEIL